MCSLFFCCQSSKLHIFKNWQFLDPEKEAENELRDIAEEVRGLRLSEVLEHHGVHVEIDTGSEKKALCPFHMDNTIGSFSINDAKGTGGPQYNGRYADHQYYDGNE